ncbi:MAG: hypothetical protein MUE40_14755 [Anaerolineae bacterium]|jgi:hypothetical protein|nr:hypothetical protein [Anaerolineae bacterium]
MYANNDILFPHSAIGTLRGLRGPHWARLVERVLTLPENHEETLAFMLMMVRLNGCLTCETDSYRAMRGCAACAGQTLRRFKGDDEELFGIYQAALKDVRRFARDHQQYTIDDSAAGGEDEA